MIKVSVLTEVEFEDEDEFWMYVGGSDAKRVTGFQAELAKAWDKNEPVTFSVPNRNHGKIVTSTISVEETR